MNAHEILLQRLSDVLATVEALPEAVQLDVLSHMQTHIQEREVVLTGIPKALSPQATSKVSDLTTAGFRQLAVVMAGPGGCATVSTHGRVHWLTPANERSITGAAQTEADRLRGNADAGQEIDHDH